MRLIWRVIISVSVPIVLAAGYLFYLSSQAVIPYDSSKMFTDLEVGELWNGNAEYIDDWYALEALDESTYIIGEPRSSQYNSSYLVVGAEAALLIDAGSSERPEGSRTMREIVESLTDKPVTLVISHFHFDHTGDLDAFDGVILVDQPYLRRRARLAENSFDPGELLNGIEAIGKIIVASNFETAFAGARDIKVRGMVKSGTILDLGDREVQVVSSIGHTMDSVSVIDHANRYAFTGDFLYQHLGGIVAFAPGSDLNTYIESINAFVSKAGPDYRYFGAHGLQEYDYDWAMSVHDGLAMIRDGVVEPKVAGNYMSPGIPLKLYREDPLLIYLTPFFDARFVFSDRFVLLMALAFSTIAMSVFIALSSIHGRSRTKT